MAVGLKQGLAFADFIDRRATCLHIGTHVDGSVTVCPSILCQDRLIGPERRSCTGKGE